MNAAAFFDVDGTLLHGNIVSYYVHLRTHGMPAILRGLWIGGFALTVPYWMVLDRCSRSRFQRAFYRNYRRIAAADLETRARAHWERHMAPRLYEGALERIREHRRRGDAVVLVTGSLRPIVAPLAASLGVDEVLAPQLRVADGRFTGDLDGPPLAAEQKAAAAAACAARRGLDLGRCHAYADSLDDLPLLRRVGHPVAVNPGEALRRIAGREGWEILDWRPRRGAAVAAP
jgi:HAD superfamily hydrolase (TIGR01490 family)